jgi:hypothetical protein
MTKLTETQNLQQPAPRSAFDRTGGIVYFARMLDKTRLHGTGLLKGDYDANLGAGFDGRCCRFLGVEYPEVRKRTLEGGGDDEILAWCFSRGVNPSDEQILVWNKFMLKRGWRDEDDGSTGKSWKPTRRPAAYRNDLVTFFDYYEVDEGRDA